MYPQYQYRYVSARDGEEGGGFWQQVINYFGSCGEGGGGGASANFRKIIPPTVDTKVPEAEAEIEKQGEPPKESVIDRKPSKPFYYVLPPSPGFTYYFPQPDLFKPQIIPPNAIQSYISSTSFRKSNAKSINVQVVSQNDEKNTDNRSDVKFSNGHANEKNVN